MTYHADMSPLGGDCERPFALAVGWLDADHIYTTGECPREVVTAVEEAVRHPSRGRAGYRGGEARGS